MSLNNARISLFEYTKDNWSATSLVFKGERKRDAYAKGRAPWLFIDIRWGRQIPKSVVASKQYYATPGTLVFSLYSRPQDGSGVIDIYTDQLFSIFRGKTIDGNIVKSMDVLADREVSGWQVRDLAISFTLRTIETIS